MRHLTKRRAVYAALTGTILVLIYNALGSDTAFGLILLTAGANYAARWLYITSHWDIHETPQGFETICYHCDQAGGGVITNENLSLPAAFRTAHRHYRIHHAHR